MVSFLGYKTKVLLLEVRWQSAIKGTVLRQFKIVRIQTSSSELQTRLLSKKLNRKCLKKLKRQRVAMLVNVLLLYYLNI